MWGGSGPRRAGAPANTYGISEARRGAGSRTHANRLERDWAIIRAEASLSDVRFHDLRHSFASVLVGEGLSLEIIGKLLGHSRPGTTKRYAHLADAPLREAAEIAARRLRGAK